MEMDMESNMTTSKTADEIAQRVIIKGQAYQECKKRRDILSLRLRTGKDLREKGIDVDIEKIEQELKETEIELDKLATRLFDVND